MALILAISGKKQSGKTTLVNFLKPYFEERGSTVKCYSFADPIKDFLVSAVGLQIRQVHGTDEEKNSLTDYHWDNFPNFIRWDNNGRCVEWNDFNGDRVLDHCEETDRPDLAYDKAVAQGFRFNNHLRTGPMSGRELMQVFGTDIGRRMFSPMIWVNATFRCIRNDNPDIALIPDMRFPSEMQGIKENEGFVIRLTRDVSNGDKHPSETALDEFQWEDHSDIVRIVPPEASIEEVEAIAVNFFHWIGMVKA